MNRNDIWIVSVGPNEGRGSTHAYGPGTPKGPVRVIKAEVAAELLEGIAIGIDNGLASDVASATLKVLARDCRGDYDD